MTSFDLLFSVSFELCCLMSLYKTRWSPSCIIGHCPLNRIYTSKIRHWDCYIRACMSCTIGSERRSIDVPGRRMWSIAHDSSTDVLFEFRVQWHWVPKRILLFRIYMIFLSPKPEWKELEGPSRYQIARHSPRDRCFIVGRRCRPFSIQWMIVCF